MPMIPMARSLMAVEKPVTEIKTIFREICVGQTSRRVFFFPQKCSSIKNDDTYKPIAVAIPAPRIPRSSINTKT